MLSSSGEHKSSLITAEPRWNFERLQVDDVKWRDKCCRQMDQQTEKGKLRSKYEPKVSKGTSLTSKESKNGD